MDLQDRLTQMTVEVERLKMDKTLQRDEICSLRAEARSLQHEISTLNHQIRDIKAEVLQDAPATNVGREVRLRFLELHRRRMGMGMGMGKGKGKVDEARIKCGNRAAHRGRPVVDALLCLTGLMDDDEVYTDLYGVTPRTAQKMMHIPEMIEVMGFHASLKADGKLTPEFRSLFERLLTSASMFSCPMELRTAFREDKALQNCHSALQDCFDRIVAASLPR
jgi:hypothetical protein